MSEFLRKLSQKLEDYTSDDNEEAKDPLEHETAWASFNCPELHYNLKCFGVKKGCIEIAGESTAGKTTLGLIAIADYLKKDPNAICIFALSEERFDDAYAKRLGVDLKRVKKIKSNFVEDLFYKIQIFIDEIYSTWKDAKMQGKPKIAILWDSISATNSRAELATFQENAKSFKESLDKGKEFKMKHAKMADFAMSAKRCVKALFAQLYEKDILMICLNHLTANLDSLVGGKHSTGGSWREFFCWLRLEMSVDKLATSKMKIDEERWAQISIVKVIKNDFGSYKNTKIKICLGYGLTLTDNDVEYALQKKILTKDAKGKISFMNGKLLWSTPRTFYTLYREQNPLLKVLHLKIQQARHEDILTEKGLEG